MGEQCLMLLWSSYPVGVEAWPCLREDLSGPGSFPRRVVQYKPWSDPGASTCSPCLPCLPYTEKSRSCHPMMSSSIRKIEVAKRLKPLVRGGKNISEIVAKP